MLALIILTFSVFFVLWIADFYLTMKTAKKIGSDVEINPIMRHLLRIRGQYVWIFKVTELALFFYLIYFLTSFESYTPFYTLLGYIIFYGIMVANNSKVYYEVTGKESQALRYAFLSMIIFLVIFIYLDKMNYANLNVAYQALYKCNNGYNEAVNLCIKQNVSVKPVSDELNNVIRSLNLTISKPWEVK